MTPEQALIEIFEKLYRGAIARERMSTDKLSQKICSVQVDCWAQAIEYVRKSAAAAKEFMGDASTRKDEDVAERLTASSCDIAANSFPAQSSDASVDALDPLGIATDEEILIADKIVMRGLLDETSGKAPLRLNRILNRLEKAEAQLKQQASDQPNCSGVHHANKYTAGGDAGYELARAIVPSENSILSTPVGSNPRTSRAPSRTGIENNELPCANEPNTAYCAPANASEISDNILHTPKEIELMHALCPVIAKSLSMARVGSAENYHLPDASAIIIFLRPYLRTSEPPLIERRIGFTCERTGKRWEFTSITKLIEAFLDATQPTKPVSGCWQPIETAPRDGSVVHVWLRTWLEPVPAYFVSREYLANEYDNPVYMEEGWYPSNGFLFDLPEVHLEPTHWMPLPKPPAALDHPSQQGEGV